MVGTTSATQRRSFALTGAISAGRKHLLNHLIILGNGDLLRGIFIAFAAFLTTTGVATPQLGTETVAAFLFLAGAGLVVIAFRRPTPPNARSFENVKSVEAAPIVRPAQPLGLSLPRTLTELLHRAEPRANAIGLASWAHLTNRMSHELRTPLNAVLGFSELMSSEAFGPLGSDRYSDYARSIHQSGRTLLKSAEDALAITALLTAPERKSRAAAALVSVSILDAVAFLSCDLTSRRISVEIDCDPDLEIIAEASTVRQILINLLFEAADRAAEGATIRICAKAVGIEVEISISIAPELQSAKTGEETFSLLLARTLIELSGASLIENHTADGAWLPAARFARVTQHDFFLGIPLH
jgi:signal transduction histidine kinase